LSKNLDFELDLESNQIGAEVSLEGVGDAKVVTVCE
jgi:hypothetical protein